MGEAGGALQPFVQFLNIDSSHAVRLLTPYFERPISTPITVFCVAIATEDGCFFSGLQKRFEMGHMYPTEFNAEINEDRSPICLNAEYADRNSRPSSNNYIDNGSPHGGSDSEDCANAARGQLGPGSWHCYVAIFNGDQSVIRIDGEEESIDCVRTIPPSFHACLDGITIGSDHSFDMSLCFGEGSDNEGEGAISELAFFKGSLHHEDIVSLESHLMRKHGIQFPKTSRIERINDDYLSRLAHKLMEQSPSCANRKKDPDKEKRHVPLRYMTGLRQVAWKQNNTVTGRQLSIKRIGNKSRNGSTSEW